jgi:hypothetical protein
MTKLEKWSSEIGFDGNNYHALFFGARLLAFISYPE